jgi:hypothetical protein
MPDVQWYYARNDKQFGPVTAVELKQLADGGELAPDDLLWREGMENWTTAVNLRGLFEPEAAAVVRDTIPVDAPQLVPQLSTRRRSSGISLAAVVRFTQVTLWTVCVLVVLGGAVLFTRAFLAAQDASQETAAGAVFSTFFIGAYVLARAGDKLSRMLLAAARRRAR